MGSSDVPCCCHLGAAAICLLPNLLCRSFPVPDQLSRWHRECNCPKLPLAWGRSGHSLPMPLRIPFQLLKQGAPLVGVSEQPLLLAQQGSMHYTDVHPAHCTSNILQVFSSAPWGERTTSLIYPEAGQYPSSCTVY